MMIIIESELLIDHSIKIYEIYHFEVLIATIVPFKYRTKIFCEFMNWVAIVKNGFKIMLENMTIMNEFEKELINLKVQIQSNFILIDTTKFEFLSESEDYPHPIEIIKRKFINE
jgi:hypothetical protein